MEFDSANLSEHVCRNCHEEGGEVIAPCRCSGSIKWIHRSCLDTWRSVSPNPQSFKTCDVCKFNYKMIERREKTAFANIKFAFLVIRDLLATIIAVNLVIMLLGFLISLADPEAKLAKLIPNIHLVKYDWNPVSKKFAIIYEFGTVAFFFILGLICICFFIYRIFRRNPHRGEYEAVSYERYPYRSSYYCSDWYFIYCMWPNYGPGSYYYGPCYCNSCNGFVCPTNCNDCKMDNDAGGVLAIIVIVIVAVIVILGAVFGVALLFFLTTKVAQRHWHVLNRRKHASVMEVADLSKHPEDLNEDFGDNSEIIVDHPVVPLYMEKKSYERV